MGDEFDDLKKYWKVCNLTFLFWLILDLSPATRAFPLQIAILNLILLILVLPACFDFYSRMLLAQRKYALSNSFAGMAVSIGELMNLLPGNPYAQGLPYALSMQCLTFNKLERGSAGERTARRLLAFYEERKDVPALRRAQTYVLLGSSLSQQGKYAQSEAATKQAIEIFEAEKNLPPSKIAASLADLCATLSFEGKSKPAIQFGNKALRLMENCSGDDKTELILLGMTLNNLAVAYDNAGNSAKALELYKRSLKLKLSIFGDNSREAVIGLNNAGYAMLREMQIPKSAEYLEKAKKLAVELELQGSRLWPNIMANCGDLHREQGKFDEAKQELLDGMKAAERLKSANDISESHFNLGKFYRDTKNFAESETHFRKALSLREKQYGSDHYKVCVTLEEYAKLLQQQNQEIQGNDMQSRAAQIRSKLAESWDV